MTTEPRAIRFERIVADTLKNLSPRDREIVRENVLAVRADPQNAGHPSGLRRAKPLAWQHVCPHSWVVLYRWQGGDQTHDYGVITIEDLVERF
jgi:hypothetical protein